MASPKSSSVVDAELPAVVSADDAPHIRLATLETARLDLDSPDWLAVASGSLWVMLDPGTVVRVDPEKARVEKRVVVARGPEEFGLCQGFGSTGDAIWSCTPFGSIERIDTSTSRVTDRLLIRMRSDQGRLVVASGRLWILQSGNLLVGIDLEDNKLGASIPLGASCTDLTARGPIVWAVCPAENQVLRVDTRAAQVTARLGLPEPRSATVRDDLWVGFKGGVAQVDPLSLSVDAVYDVLPGIGGRIWAGAHRVWVRCDGGPFLVGIDPVAHRIVGSVTASTLPSGGDVVGIGGQLWATAFDDRTLVRLRLPAT